MDARRELGDFLRSRRERVTPEQAGLPLSGRRRTPGLRREEVATLAGVGVTWYTWLEQGRSINASAQVLQSICRTLQLTEAEYAHVWDLAGLPSRGAVDPTAADVADLRTAFQPVLDKLDPYPAVIQDHAYSVLAYNRAYRFLIDDFDAHPVGDRNCMKLFFLNDAWRAGYLDPDIVAGRMVAKFRATAARRLNDPSIVALLDELCSRSAQFADLWSRHDVLVHNYEVKRLQSTRVGLLQLNFVWTYVDQQSGTRMTTMTPTDEVTAQRLQQLAERTADIPDSGTALAG